MSDQALAGHHRWSTDTLKSFWILTYPSATPNRDNVRPDVTKVDWGFIIGYVLSLVALLFTFDSISGERERGTLRLTLANAIPRHTVLIGKFLGAFISVNIPFILAVLVNLLVISTSSGVHLDSEAWGRLGIIFFVAVLYTCLFLALGLLVSARVQRSAVSLVILLLVWVVLVVFMPSTLASIAGRSTSSGPTYDFWERSSKLHDELSRDYYSNRHKGPKGSTKRIEIDSAYVTKDAEQQEQLHEERLNRRIAEVHRARTITRISPVTIVQNLIESFAGTGFERHLQFLENVKIYIREFRTFIVDTDSADPESLHIFGAPTGMSQEPVSPEAVPKFEDTLSLSKDFNTRAIEMLLLALFVVVLLSGVYLAFVRVEV
jgi:ABC-type transport system involved in multi-copper enzyme maturation permease subunit